MPMRSCHPFARISQPRSGQSLAGAVGCAGNAGIITPIAGMDGSGMHAYKNCRHEGNTQISSDKMLQPKRRPTNQGNVAAETASNIT
jgi:hypothetical protein